MTTSSLSARPNALDRLRSLYRSPGPYTSLYLPCGDLATTSPHAAFERARTDLAEQGASDRALDALAARLTLPVPDDVGGWALHAADDGSTAVDFAPEGPTSPVMGCGVLPMAAPLIEWDQWRVPHVAVSIDPTTSEVVSFLPGAEPSIAPLPRDTTAAAAALRVLAIEEQLRLVVIIGTDGHGRALADQLPAMMPPSTNVVELSSAESATVEAGAAATVRYVADVVARDTVRALEDFRFLHAGGDAVEGNAAVFEALASGRVRQLLVHDDPHDPTSASFGPTPLDVSADYAEYSNIGRRADVAIWSAVQQGTDVRVVPSTSATGPNENIAAILRNGTADRR